MIEADRLVIPCKNGRLYTFSADNHNSGDEMESSILEILI